MTRGTTTYLVNSTLPLAASGGQSGLDLELMCEARTGTDERGEWNMPYPRSYCTRYRANSLPIHHIHFDRMLVDVTLIGSGTS